MEQYIHRGVNGPRINQYYFVEGLCCVFVITKIEDDWVTVQIVPHDGDDEESVGWVKMSTMLADARIGAEGLTHIDVLVSHDVHKCIEILKDVETYDDFRAVHKLLRI